MRVRTNYNAHPSVRVNSPRPGGRTLDPMEKEEMLSRFKAMYAQGHSDSEIALAIGVSSQTTFRWRNHDLKLPANPRIYYPKGHDYG